MWRQRGRSQYNTSKTSCAESIVSDPIQSRDDYSSKVLDSSSRSGKSHHQLPISRPITLDPDEVRRLLDAEYNNDVSISDDTTVAASSTGTGNCEVLIVGMSNRSSTNVGNLAVLNSFMVGLMHFLLTEPTQDMERLVWLLSVR